MTAERGRTGTADDPDIADITTTNVPITNVPDVPGITDAFLTCLKDIGGGTPEDDGSFEEQSFGRKTVSLGGSSESLNDSTLWYLYGRMADQKTQNGTGIVLWTSADLRHWSTPTPVLGGRDIPWATLSRGRNSAFMPGRTAPSHPAVLRCDGKVYLYFELDGQIGAAWAPSPAGPFTVRRTPLLRLRQWGRTTDPGVLGIPAEVDEFGEITPVADRPVRTDWLLWRGADPGNSSGHDASGTVTLCTLSQDRMELALGVHRSREIRVTPPRTGVDKTGQAAATTVPPLTAIAHTRSTTAHVEEKSPSYRQPTAGTGTQATRQNPSRTASRIISPQIVRLGRRFYLLWIDGTGRILSSQADHLTGPWKEASAVIFAGDTGDNDVSDSDRGDGHTSHTSASDTLPGSLPSSLSGIPVRLSVAGSKRLDARSTRATNLTAQNQAILTLSDQTSTHFFVLNAADTRLTARMITED